MAKRQRDPRSSPAIVQVSIAPTETLVLGDTEIRWTEIFAAAGKTYHPLRLRLSEARRDSAVALDSF
jgi:predicted metalloprotease